MKKCSKCKNIKSLSEYYFRKDQNRYRADCKTCCNINAAKNRERPEVIRRNIQYQQEYRKNNNQKLLEKKKEYYSENRKEIREKQLKYRKTKRKELATQQREYYKKNKKVRLAYGNKYRRKRFKEDSLFKLQHNLRGRLNGLFKGKVKSKKTEKILGCSWEYIRQYLSEDFKIRNKYDFDWQYYTENNQAKGWHIDHIIPLASAETEEELYQLCHYSNLQILWWEENLAKNGKILVK